MKIAEKDQEIGTEMEGCLSVDEVRFPVSGLPEIHPKVIADEKKEGSTAPLEETQKTVQSLSNAHAKEKSTDAGERTSLRADNSVSRGRTAVQGHNWPEEGRGAPVVMEIPDGYGDSWRGGHRLEMPTFNGEKPNG